MGIRKSWDWWRHNHFMSRKAAAFMTFKNVVVWPLSNAYSWCWFKIIGKYKLREIRKLKKELAEQVLKQGE